MNSTDDGLYFKISQFLAVVFSNLAPMWEAIHSNLLVFAMQENLCEQAECLTFRDVVLSKAGSENTQNSKIPNRANRGNRGNNL